MQQSRFDKYNAFNAKPFVGYVSSGNTIEFVREGTRFVCRQTKGSQALMFLILIGVSYMGYAVLHSDEAMSFQEFLNAPLQEQIVYGLIALMLVFMVGATFIFALTKILVNGKIVMDPGGSLTFYTGWFNQESRTIKPHEMAYAYMDTVTFQGKHQTYTNYILVLILKSQEELVLCAAAEQELAKKFLQELTTRAGLKK